MSLVYQETPATFQPVLSDGIFFTLSANTTNNFKFRYVYDLYVEDELVFQGKATPNPYGLGVVDLQQILETYCYNNPISKWGAAQNPIYTHQTFPFSAPYYDEVINFYLVAGYEYADSALGSITGFTGQGDAAGDPATYSNVYKTFRSTMGVNSNATLQDFNINPYVMSSSTSQFLTNSPTDRELAPEDYYTLAFTNYYLSQNTVTSPTLSEPYYVKYRFYNSTGGTISEIAYPNIYGNGGGVRSLATDVYQALYLIIPPTGDTASDYNTLYVGAGPKNLENIMPTGCTSYDVQLWGLFEGSTTPIQPTPTPTPTHTATLPPTPTPSVTPVCSGCEEYTVTYTGASSFGSVTITNCYTNLPQSFKANYGVPYDICSCGTPTGIDITVVASGAPCVPIPPTPTPSPTLSPTPSPSTVVYNFLGRSVPDALTSSEACDTYTTVRGYQAIKSLSTLTVGDYLYDSYPGTPTNGSDLWIALKVGGVGASYAFQVAIDGEILDSFICFS